MNTRTKTTRLERLERKKAPKDEIRVFLCHCGHAPGAPCTCPDRLVTKPGDTVIRVGVRLEDV